jgi:hypothetical protein
MAMRIRIPANRVKHLNGAQSSAKSRCSASEDGADTDRNCAIPAVGKRHYDSLMPLVPAIRFERMTYRLQGESEIAG